MMIEYNTLDIAELLEEAGVNPLEIEEMTAVWGDTLEEVWCGGCCFSTYLGEYYMIHKSPHGIQVETADTEFEPMSSDYDSCPWGVSQWLESGAEMEHAHEY